MPTSSTDSDSTANTSQGAGQGMGEKAAMAMGAGGGAATGGAMAGGAIGGGACCAGAGYGSSMLGGMGTMAGGSTMLGMATMAGAAMAGGALGMMMYRAFSGKKTGGGAGGGTAPVAPPAIQTVDDLRTHIVSAMQLELCTIPAYMNAYYSFRDTDSEPAQSVRSVLLEEMLHLTYACNLLLSTGDTVKLYDPDFVLQYPATLPNHEPTLTIPLGPASEEQMQVFLEIELPENLAVEESAGGDDPDTGGPEAGEYHTIGQFYEAIEQGFVYLDSTQPEVLWADTQAGKQFFWFRFDSGCGESPESTIDEDSFNVTGTPDDPELGPVTDLRTAVNAIVGIIQQGEGAIGPFADPDRDELAHYYKFKAVADDFASGALGEAQVYPCLVNPKLSDYKGEVQKLARLANACYYYLLKSLDAIYALEDGQDPRDDIIDNNVKEMMTSILRRISARLVQLTVSKGVRAAMTYEFWDFEAESTQLAEGRTLSPKEQIQWLYSQLSDANREACGDDLESAIEDLVPIP